jgi:LDH2 family malate/lactate/ureidoglycolate dehydrogenase
MVAGRVAVSDLKQFVMNCLMATRLSEDHSRITTEALVTTDEMGVFTHGTKLLVGYLRKLLGGGYPVSATPVVERQGPAWACIDGQAGLGQVGCYEAVRLAIAKARQCGIAYVGLRNTGHIGAAGYFASLAAVEGMIAMVTGNDIPSVAAPGARGAVLGSNPLAYAIPFGLGEPILLDMATAAVAGGKVYAACQRGEPIPPTWLIGPDGLPTTDGSLYPAKASLAPMAGHKGYGIGLWCEVLSGVLPGGCVTWQVGSWMFDPADQSSRHNASFTVIDVNAIADRTLFDEKLKRLIDEIHSARAAEGVQRVLIPGEREWKLKREAERNGISLPEDVIEKLRQAGAMVGVEPKFLS